jgi:uncharacterized repeat protein (TIGR01451 family)
MTTIPLRAPSHARATPARSRRRRRFLETAWTACALLLLSGTANAAGPGSGIATIAPAGPVVAGSAGSWTLTYTAEENFPRNAFGGIVDFEIPAGWSVPTLTLGQEGQVTVTSPHVSDVSLVPPRTVRVRVGDAPNADFDAGMSFQLVYGGGGGAGAIASTAAPATVTFQVSSDPNAQDGINTVPLTNGSPTLDIVPDALESVRVEDAAGNPIGAFTRSADEDTTQLFLRGYDTYGNSLGLVSGAWSVLGGIGAVSPATGSSVTLALTTVGSGSVVADVGGTSDATGAIDVTPGAYVALAFSTPSAGTAGAAFAAAVDATDADGNVVTSGAGSGAALRFVAYAASSGPAAADPNFVDDTATLTAGAYSGSLTPRRSGHYWVAARDENTLLESARVAVTVAAGAPHHLSFVHASLALVAGAPDTLTVEVRDAFENPTPLAAAEVLALWSNRPAGEFQDLGGTPIYEITIASGDSTASLLFRDTQAVAAGGLARAIDAGMAPPYLGIAEASIATAPASPAGTVAVTVAPDTLEADGASAAAVTTSAVRDAYGNVVSTGSALTIVGSGVAPAADADPGTAGVQWLTDGAGVASGAVVAGTARGAGSVAVSSVVGSASGASPVLLLAGAPAGSIALGAAPASIVADGAATSAISASGLVDANGNSVEDGERYTVSTTLGTIATPDADAGTPGVQVLAAGGAIAFTLQAGTTLGTANVAAVSVRGSASGSTGVPLVAGPVDGVASSVTAASPAAVGPAGSTVTVTLRDAQSHPLPGVSAASIAVSVAGVPATVAALGAATDAGGALDFRVTTTVADTATISATALGTPLLDTPAVLFTAGAVDHYAAVGPAPPLLAGRTDTLQVTAYDVYGNPAPGADGSRMSVRVLGGLAMAPDTVSFAGASSVFEFTPTAVTQLTLLLQEVVPPLRTVQYGPVAVSPAGPYAIDSLHVAAATLAAGDSTLVQVWVADAHGNLQPNASVSGGAVAGGGSVTPALATTDGGGLALFRIHAGPTPGATQARFLVTASPAPDSVRSDTVAVTVVPAAASVIEIVNSTGGIVAGGLLNVTLTLRDAFGNLVPTATPLVHLRTTTPSPSLDNVRWSVTAGAAGSLSDSTASDGAAYQFVAADSGTAVVAVRDTLAETIRLRASGPGLPLAETAPIAIGPAPPTQIAVVSGQGQTGTVADTLALPLRVRARDSFGNLTPGAVVRFTVTGGGGLVDAILGAPATGDATADALGIARCDVWRLGSTAGAGNAVRAELVATPSSFTTFTATATPDTAFSLALAPASLSLGPTQNSVVTATARDAYGNVVPAVPLTLYLAGPSYGSLEAVGGATTGGPGSQSGTTSAAGTLAVRYVAPAAAPAVDSIYVRSAMLGPVGIRATVGAGATASLRVTADSLTWTAGAAVRVRVEPLDAQGNVVVGDPESAVMRPVTGVGFAPPSGALASGAFQTFATATVAGSIASVGADRTGAAGIGGATGPVVVRPAAPSGAIPVTATRTTLTADGRSVATITLGPVRDAYGNIVSPGSVLAASIGAGTLAAASLTTDAAGMASTVLIAPASTGSTTFSVASVPAGASGSLGFTYLAPPALSAAAPSLVPTIVAPGAAVAFQLSVTNTGAGTLTLQSGTRFEFGPAGAVVSATLSGAPLALSAGVPQTLTFVSTTVPAAMPPGSYAPSLRAVGVDATSEPFDFYPSLAGAAVHVAGATVAGIGATPDPVPLGHADLRLSFDVTNLAASAATLESASLSFSAGAFTLNGFTPPLPAALPALGTTTLVASVRVPVSGIADGALVDAALTVGARYGSVNVAAANATPLSFRVVSGAALSAVAGGTVPARYLRSRTFAPAAAVRNNGAADVTLLRDQTLLLLGNAAGDTLSFRLLANQVVAGGDQALLSFDSLAVPGAAPLGAYGATLRFRGTESGQPFAAEVPADPAVVTLLDPATLSVTALAPDTVSAGQTRALQVTVSNAGGVDYLFEAATTLRLAGPVATTLALAAPVTAPAGGSVTLAFTAAPIGSPASPGAAPATLEARGREDGWAREENVAAGTLQAMAPASLAYVDGTASPDTVRAGQTVTLTASVRNDGGSPFLVDPAATRIVVTDGVESATGFAAGSPFLLAPAGQATLTFPSLSFPPALASQPYPVSIDIQGTEWSLAASVTVVSAPGEVRVVEPAAALQVVAADAPKQAASGGAPLRLWHLLFDPLVPVGGAASTRLESVALTVLVEGAATAAPGGAVALIEARDGAGTLLAQAIPAGANPVLLSFTPPIDLSAGPASVFLDVTLVGGFEAEDVGLRLATENDVIARDNLSGSAVPVRAAGGLPFQALSSRRVTLFAKAHGYPNPFRAGRESVLLSYRLSADAPVQVRIVTLLGELVREISCQAGATGGTRGLNELPWDGRNGAGKTVQPGVYVARITSSDGGTDESIKIGVRR